jgi:hypothetical protein
MLTVTLHARTDDESVVMVIKNVREVQVVHDLGIPWLQVFEEDKSPAYKISLNDKTATISEQYPITDEQYDTMLDMFNSWMGSMRFGIEFTRVYNLVKTLPITDEQYNKYYWIKRVIDNESWKKMGGYDAGV